MYEQFYKFSAEPFRLSPDHAFAYSHKGYTKARAYMEYAFLRAEGFVMITGRPGTGKTTLIGALVDGLANKNVNIANLVCTQLQADDLLKLVAYDFGIPTSVVEKGELLQRLTHQFKTWHRDGRRALLIVDEAQDLSGSAMEELRLLTNIQIDSRPLLQIFLLGQPELRDLILSPRLEQVHQRIIAASHLQPLECDETEDYIRHRLSAVRWQGDPAISKAVYPLIYKFSEGVPRRINLICSRLLLHCAVEQRHQVTVADVREVVGELQNENLASGNSFLESDFNAADVFDDPQIASAQIASAQLNSLQIKTLPVAARPAQNPAPEVTPSLAVSEQRIGNANATAPANGSANNSQAARLPRQDENARLQQKQDHPALKMVVGGVRPAPMPLSAQARVEPRKESVNKPLAAASATSGPAIGRTGQGSTPLPGASRPLPSKAQSLAQKPLAQKSLAQKPLAQKPLAETPVAHVSADATDSRAILSARPRNRDRHYPKPKPQRDQSDRTSAVAASATPEPVNKGIATQARSGGNVNSNWPITVMFVISLLLVTWAVISFGV